MKGTRFLLGWQYIRKHWVATIFIVFVGVIVLIVLGYLLKWDWTGFNSGTNQITITSTSKVNYTATMLQPSKSLWDWLNLLGVLAIPVVVGLGAAWYTAQQGKVSDRENTDNQHETALQAYIDKISELLLKEHLDERTADGKLKPEYEQVRNVARVRTITVLTQLDARRIGYVFTFLNEAKLMSPTFNDDAVSLGGADFHSINWAQANLSQANFNRANLSYANLSYAKLDYANLSLTDLSNANLSGAKLYHADLSADLNHADLRNASLGKANLSGANLAGADLRNARLGIANLSGAALNGADLSNANLAGARGTTPGQLAEAKSLKGATMPDGSIHP